MPSDSKGTSKTKRKSTTRSRVKSKSDSKSKKTGKRKKKTQQQINEEAKAAFAQVEENKETDKPVTSVVQAQLVTQEELEKITRDNSFMLNPIIANASLQKDLLSASRRAQDLESLHEYLFDPVNQSQMDDKTLVTLYSIAINDHHKTIGEKIKISEISDKNRVLRDTMKYYVEKEKEREIEAADNTHTSEIIQALLAESMRKSLEDEIQKKWGGSNSYRPPENDDYEILAVDLNADD